MSRVNTFKVETATQADADEIRSLYLKVAAVEGGLARAADEISADYVGHFVRTAVETGVIVVARDNESNSLVGEIHGYALGPRVFAHVLGELTIAVHPEYQGSGIGKALFTEFMRQVIDDREDILRVELIARESNEKAIRFYGKIGFSIEGRFAGRIKSVSGGFEDDIPMAWLRPGA